MKMLIIKFVCVVFSKFLDSTDAGDTLQALSYDYSATTEVLNLIDF